MSLFIFRFELSLLSCFNPSHISGGSRGRFQRAQKGCADISTSHYGGEVLTRRCLPAYQRDVEGIYRRNSIGDVSFHYDVRLAAEVDLPFSNKMGKVKIRGIFATWTVADVAKSPEMVFRLKLETNPTHPFVPLSESSNKLILRMRSQQIFIGIITILAASALAVALYYTQGNESLRGGGSSIFSVPAFIGAWGFALVIFNVQVSLSATTSIRKGVDQSIRMIRFRSTLCYIVAQIPQIYPELF